MYHQYKEGWIEVICGCMFAGKTEELVRRINVLNYAKKNIKIFKPKIDNRYSETEIVTHLGIRIPCIIVENSEEILEHIDSKVDAVVIDEIQFMDEKIIDICEYLADKGIRVTVAGLDQDFRGECFPVMGELLSKAEFISKLTAVCAVCGAPATKTQRLVDGRPARFNDATILLGSANEYEPRCRHCHEVVEKPKKKIFKKAKI